MVLPRLVVVATLVLRLGAQAVDDPEATSRAVQRATDDLAVACRELLAQPVAFTGTCHYRAARAPQASGREPIPFCGAWDRGLSRFRVLDFTVLSHGDRMLQRTGDGAWTAPQGDAPDLPFSPRALARHIGSATLTKPEPAFVDGRPAVRVQATWTGEAAAALLRETYHPESTAQKVLERLPQFVRKGDVKSNTLTTVEGAIWFDPATRTLRSAVLRFALLQPGVGQMQDADDEAPPEGLPPLAGKPLLTYTFAVTVVPPSQVTLPELDDSLRQRLQWPPVATGSPAADPTIR